MARIIEYRMTLVYIGKTMPLKALCHDILIAAKYTDKCGLPFTGVVKNRATKTAMTTEAIVSTGRGQATRSALRVVGKLLEYFCWLF